MKKLIWNKLGLRTITGLIYGLVIIFGIFAGTKVFSLILFILSITAFYEYIRIIRGEFISKTTTFFILIAGALLFTIVTFILSGFLNFIFLLIYLLSIISVFTLFIEKNYFSLASIITFGLIWIILPFSIYSGFLLTNSNKPILMIVPLSLCWVNDIFAYLGGITYGKHSLFPKSSPHKTVEGFLTGMVFTIFTSWLFYKIYNLDNLTIWLIVGFFASLGAVIGDLIESKFKRHYQIKDTGNFLPGHGGILDRIDSYLLVSMVFIIFFKYLI